ncbi:MAG: hypothetical protein HOV68_33235, partial [Streptomycetaceae bacterium]|nr:hypothetical protein [Streptomycetaceae bacterium]
HLVALASLAGHAAWIVVEHRRAKGPFALAVVGGLAPLAPLLALAAGQRQRQVEWIPRPELDTVQTLLPRLAASGPVAVALAVLALGAWTGRARRGVLVAYTWMAVLPVAVVWVASRAGDTSYFLPRYLLFTLPAWAVLAGAGVAVLATGRAAAGLLAVAVVAALGVPDQRALRAAGAHEERNYPEPSTISWIDYAGVAQLVRAGLRPGDGIVYSSIDQRLWHVDTGVEYYLRGGPRPRDVLAGESGEARDDLWTYDCLTAAPCLDAADADRIWLVTVVLRGTPHDPYAGLFAEKARALRERYHVVSGVAVPGAYVSLLERGATPAEPAPSCAPLWSAGGTQWPFGPKCPPETGTSQTG